MDKARVPYEMLSLLLKKYEHLQHTVGRVFIVGHTFEELVEFLGP